MECNVSCACSLTLTKNLLLTAGLTPTCFVLKPSGGVFSKKRNN